MESLQGRGRGGDLGHPWPRGGGEAEGDHRQRFHRNGTAREHSRARCEPLLCHSAPALLCPQPDSRVSAGPHCICAQMGFFQNSWFVINCETPAICYLLRAPRQGQAEGWGWPFSPTPRPGLLGLTPLQTDHPTEGGEGAAMGLWVSRLDQCLANFPCGPSPLPFLPAL